MRRVFSESFFRFRGRGQFPHALHLLVAVVVFHRSVVEKVFGFRGFARPQQGFVGVREIATRQMRRRVGFVPRDVVEDFKTEGLQRETDRINVVRSARNPQRAVGLEQAMALRQPLRVEFVNLRGSRAFVPVAFVNGDHVPVLASDAARRQKIRRIGKNQIERFAFRAFKKFERVALIQTNAAFTKNRFRRVA